MRRLLIVLIPLLLVLSAQAGDASAAADRHSCAAHGSRTVDVTRSVRIYKLTDGLYACAYRAGIRTRLGDLPIPCSSSSPCGGAFVDAIAGRWVAVEQVDGHPRNSRAGANLAVYDSVTGQRRFDYNSRTATDAPAHDFAYTVQVRLNASGVVAFTTALYSPDEERQLHVGSVKPTNALVDQGVGIDPFSVALAGTTAYWKHDGVVRSFELPE
jgi:hypothetical protein